MKMTGDGGPPESSSYDGNVAEEKRGITVENRRSGEGQPVGDLEGRARWRHEMPWHRLPVCNGRESRYDLRSTTPPTSSVSQAKLGGSMVAIIRSRLARRMAQRESDDALNMDFFPPVAKSWQKIHINCDWLLMNVRSNQPVILMTISDAHLFSAVNLYLLNREETRMG